MYTNQIGYSFELNGKTIETCEIQFWALWPEFWELAETNEETSDDPNE